MANPLRVGVVGAGHLGKHHARIYHELENVTLVGVCDTDSSKKEIAAAHHAPFFPKHKDLIGKVDAVSIATPTSQHFRVAKDFIEAGVHVLIEKPITLKLDEADQLIDLSRKRNVALQVGHIERHNPGLKRIEEIAKNIRFLEIHRLGPFTDRIKDCGVVLDLMIHDFDIVMKLMKAKIKDFDGIGIAVLTPYEDLANVRIKFENGAVADITASRLTPEAQRKIRIFQPDAYISLDYQAQKANIFTKSLFGIKQETVDIQKAEPLKEELKDFIAGIESGQSIAKPDEGARNALAFALDVIEVIKENHRLGLKALGKKV